MRGCRCGTGLFVPIIARWVVEMRCAQPFLHGFNASGLVACCGCKTCKGLFGAVNARLSEGSRLTLRGGSGLGTARVGEHTTHSAEVCWDKAAELSGDLRRVRDQRGWSTCEAVEAAVIDHLSTHVLQVTNMRGMLTY